MHLNHQQRLTQQQLHSDTRFECNKRAHSEPSVLARKHVAYIWTRAQWSIRPCRLRFGAVTAFMI
jgi:hypothetical protein